MDRGEELGINKTSFLFRLQQIYKITFLYLTKLSNLIGLEASWPSSWSAGIHGSHESGSHAYKYVCVNITPREVNARVRS